MLSGKMNVVHYLMWKKPLKFPERKEFQEKKKSLNAFKGFVYSLAELKSKNTETNHYVDYYNGKENQRLISLKESKKVSNSNVKLLCV